MNAQTRDNDTSPQDVVKLAALRTLKAEMKEQGWTERKFTLDNLLMKGMGADPPYRYDPYPPDQYLFVCRHGRTARERLMGWVCMGTIAIGRNSPFVVNELGQSQDVEDLATFFGWGMKHAEAELYSAECDGVITRDPEIRGRRRDQIKRKIYLSAKIELAHTDSKDDIETKESVHAPTPSSFLRCEPYIKKQFEELSLEVQAEALERHLAIRSLQGDLEADALASVRTFIEQLHSSNWNYAGIALREKRKTRVHPAQFDLFERQEISAGYVKVRLAKPLPAGVLVPAGGGNIPTDAQPAAPPLLLESVQALSLPDPSAGDAPQKLEHVHAKKLDVQAPTSLLPSPDLVVGIRETVEIRNTVSQSSADRLTKAKARPQAQGKTQTPSMRAATPPGATSHAPDAIPADSPKKKESPAAAARAQGQRTGLTGTPSIELRARLKAIAEAIPDELAERLHERKHDGLYKRIDQQLQNAPIEQFAAGVAAADAAGKFRRYPTLGYCVTVVAHDIGERWVQGWAKRALEATAAEAARKADDALERRRRDELTAQERKRQHLVEHPEDCTTCHGAGKFSSDLLPKELRPRKPDIRFCSCPAGERAAKKPPPGDPAAASPPDVEPGGLEFAQGLIADLKKKKGVS